MSIVTGNSYLAILIPGEMFKDLYKKFNYENNHFSRKADAGGY